MLALAFSILFFIIAISSLFNSLRSLREMAEVPIVSGSAEAYILDNDTARLVITLRHERGEPLELIRAEIITNNGKRELNFTEWAYEIAQNTCLIGFKDNKTLLPGSTARIITLVPREELTMGEQYSALVLFDKGIVFLHIYCCQKIIMELT